MNKVVLGGLCLAFAGCGQNNKPEPAPIDYPRAVMDVQHAIDEAARNARAKKGPLPNICLLIKDDNPHQIGSVALRVAPTGQFGPMIKPHELEVRAIAQIRATELTAEEKSLMAANKPVVRCSTLIITPAAPAGPSA